MVYDVAIIGAGVVGALTARALSRYNVSICLIEKEDDVAMGTTAANSAIVHAGFDAEPHTLKAILNREGSMMMEQVAKELDVEYKNNGALVLCLEEELYPKLKALYERGIENGIERLSIISGLEARALEPNLSKEVYAALYAKTSAIVGPYELAIAASENAADNGTTVMLGTAVEAIDYSKGIFSISTEKGTIECRYIVNAAGVYADSIASMIGDNSFHIRARRGEYMLMDKSAGTLVKHTIFQLPNALSKGILVTPTVEHNLLVGPTAEDVDDKESKATTSEGIGHVLEQTKRILPDLNFRDVITSFAGLRATLVPKGDFIIEASHVHSHFINVAGIESPGLSAAPAIAEYAVKILRAQGLKLSKNSEFNPIRRPVKRFVNMNEAKLKAACAENPLYAKIICRCEKVSEAEIVDVIHRNVGARTLDGVKRRTRAGMGRCQGGFCGPSVVDILARELGVTQDKITKKGKDSWILTGRSK